MLAVASFSCSKNDDDEIPVIEIYGADISNACPGGTVKSFCIDRATNQRLQNEIEVGEACQMVTFKSTDGVQRSGYLRSVGSGCSQQ